MERYDRDGFPEQLEYAKEFSSISYLSAADHSTFVHLLTSLATRNV